MPASQNPIPLDFDRRTPRPWWPLRRWFVMAIAVVVTGEVIGRLFYGALGQVPGTTGWNYALLFNVSLNVAAIGAIVAPVGKAEGLIAIGFMSLRTIIAYSGTFANATIGLTALSGGLLWGGGLGLLIGMIYLVGACNRLLRLMRQ